MWLFDLCGLPTDDDRHNNKGAGRYSSRDSYPDQAHSGYNRNQIEPEWFTDGPKHQWDTIELGGFESMSKKERSESSKSPSDGNEDNMQQNQPYDSGNNDVADGSSSKFASSQKSGEPRKPKKESNRILEDEEAMARATGTDAGAGKKKVENSTKDAAGERMTARLA